MIDQTWKKEAVESVRLTVYGVLITNGLFIQYLAPFHYTCDYSQQPCIMCGMRTAVDLWLDGKFADAVESNALILLVVVVALGMLVDTAYIIHKRRKRKKEYRPKAHK